MIKRLLDKVINMCNLAAMNPNLVGVEIGAYSLKMAGMRLDKKKPSVLFCCTIPFSKEYNQDSITEEIKKALAENKFSSKNVVLSFSDDSALFRRVELPYMPQGEILDALRWKAKEMVYFDIQSAAIGFELLGEIQKEDGSRIVDLLFVAVSKEVIDKKIKIVKDAGLNVISINMPPFGLENILKLDQEIEPSKLAMIVDVGHSKTEVSMFRNKTLEFVRSIPAGARNILEMMQGRIATDKGEIVLSEKEAEDIKNRFGISYEEVMLENGMSSRQTLSLMRPILEQLSKEVRRSIDYYIQEFDNEEVAVGYLVGGGSKLKNLDRYFSEELNIPFKKMTVPTAIDISRINLDKEDQVSYISLIGMMLGCKGELNLLPHEYATEGIEFVEKISLRVTAIIVAIILLGSFLFIKFRVEDYSRRLLNIPMQKNIILQVKDLQERVTARQAFSERAQVSQVPVEYIMKELSNVVPSGIILETLNIDQRSKSIDFKGMVYGPRGAAQEVLTRFMEDLERSKYFKDAQLSSIQGSKIDNEEVSIFEISSSLE